jgi:hypothetical protein
VQRIIFWNIKYCLVLLIIGSFLITNSINALENGVKIAPADKEVIETVPMKIIPFSFLVANGTADNRNISPEITLPKGWKLIIKDSPFELNANESDIRLISFFVPRDALAGKYNVTYSVKAKNLPSSCGSGILSVISESYNLQVSVLPINELKVNLLNAPEYILAGDKYQASFSVINESNSEKTIIIEINNRENLSSIADVKKIQLAPGESKIVNVTVKSDGKIKTLIKHNLILTAQMADDKKIIKQASSNVDIIPHVNKGGELYHRLPIRITTHGDVSNREDAIDYGFQEEIYGKGTLDEDEEKNIEFLIKGQRTSNRSYRDYDNYRLNYWTDNYKLGFGDNSYDLSPLIANRGNGRGVNGEFVIDKTKFGAFYQEDKRYIPKYKSIAGYVNFAGNEKYDISLNYIRKKELINVDIASLYGQFRPTKNINLKLEFATNKDNYAYQLQAYGSHRRISYTMQFLHGEPNYPGSNKNIERISANVAIPIWRRFGINTGFRQEKRNLSLNPKDDTAILERYYQSGVNCGFFTGNSASINYSMRTYRDRFLQPKINRDEITYGFKLGQRIKIINFGSAYERGKLRDNLINQISELESYNYNINLTPAKWLSGNVYYNRRNNINLNGEKQRNENIGLDSTLRIGDKVYFRFSYRNSDYQYPNRNYKVNSYSLNIVNKLWNNHQFSLQGRYNTYKDRSVKALTFEYRAPFNLPISRKKDIGRIKGRIYNEETNQPISNVIFILNQTTAVSDKSGKFFFPTIKIGNYKLYVNMANIGVGYIANQKIPMDVCIEDNKEGLIEIGVTRSVAITGQVMVYDFETAKQDGEEKKIVESGGLANTIAEITNGSEIRRQYTGGNGNFSFERMRPGKWTLKIYDFDLPEYHYMDKSLYEFELKPGESANVLIKALPKERRIRIIKQGEILLEEEKKSSP